MNPEPDPGLPVPALVPALVPGLRFSTTQLVDASRVIEFMGEGSGVYASSRIISDIEWACRCFPTESSPWAR